MLRSIANLSMCERLNFPWKFSPAREPDSFPLHVNQIVPSKSMNAVKMQAMLIDGIVRWNAHRESAVREAENITCADIWLKDRVQQLYESIFGTDSNFTPVPNIHTGELLAVEYLYNQSFSDQFGLIEAGQKMKEMELIPATDPNTHKVDTESSTIFLQRD